MGGAGFLKEWEFFSHASLYPILSLTFFVHESLFSLIEPFSTINPASHLFNFSSQTRPFSLDRPPEKI